MTANVGRERISEAAYFGACPRCRHPAIIAFYFKNMWAVCHDCALLLGCVGYNLISCEAQIWDSPVEMKAELRIRDWRDTFDHLESWRPEPDVPDWEAFYELVAERLAGYDEATPIYDIGPPYVDSDVNASGPEPS
jgi:hypothetical protein